MTIRKILFWLHLTSGCVAGIFIFLMCVTGVLLAFERQITAAADSHFRSSPGPNHFALESIPGKPNVTLRSDPQAPIALAYGRDRLVYLDAANGKSLGESSPALRAFFARMEGLHRALGSSMQTGVGRPINRACNLIFLALIVTGLLLWFPLRPAVWFRTGVRGKARDWNWHTVLGFWSSIPLFAISLSAAYMSYAPRPAPPQTSPTRHSERKTPHEYKALAELLTITQSQVPNWRTATFRMPGTGDPTLSVSVDTGMGGQPQKRTQVTLDRASGRILRVETLGSNGRDRQIRALARFLHTGEWFGLSGQITAALATLAGAVLVWTGISLAIRRASCRYRRGVRTAKLAADPVTR